MSGTGPQRGEKDAFGRGLGNAHQFGIAMACHRVTPEMFHLASGGDPIREKLVATALRGEEASPITLDDLIAREIELTKRWCELAESDYMGDKIVEEALRKADESWGGLSVNDRFLPGNIGLEQVFQLFVNWNDLCGEEQRPEHKVKLAVEPSQEFWRTDSDVQHLLTEPGVFRCDSPLAGITHPWDNTGTPFNLPYDQQAEACRGRGGDGLSTTEEITFLAGRGTLERPGQPSWSPLWIRCRNTCGSGSSLCVYWNAGGLEVGSWYRDFAYWREGCLPRKFVGA